MKRSDTLARFEFLGMLFKLAGVPAGTIESVVGTLEWITRAYFGSVVRYWPFRLQPQENQ